jgi:hypothetical protein
LLFLVVLVSVGCLVEFLFLPMLLLWSRLSCCVEFSGPSVLLVCGTFWSCFLCVVYRQPIVLFSFSVCFVLREFCFSIALEFQLDCWSV